MGKQESSLAEFIGITAPESPKFLVSNNFLSRYFNSDKNDSKAYKYDDFKDMLVCEEIDNNNIQRIKESFNRFFDIFTGKSIMSVNKNAVIYFPVNKTMLRTGRIQLRHLLFNLQHSDKKFNYKDIQDKLEKYLYGQNIGTNNLLSEICEDIPNNNSKADDKKDQTFDILREKAFFKSIGVNLNEDINTLLTSENFTKLDFYKKYDYLSTLLTSYVIQFILHRKEIKNQCILCKGSANNSLNRGEFHRACVLNYANIRDVFPKLLIDFYHEKMKDIESVKLKLIDGEIHTEKGILFTDFVNRLFDINLHIQVNKDPRLIRAFSLREGFEKEFLREEFLANYVNFTKKVKGSNIVKISSTLPTSGREIGFIYPSNSTKHKYFAMSGELAEFYVRLYLSSKDGLSYDYLDNFLEWLEHRYSIYTRKTKSLDKYLSKLNAKVTIQDYRKNEQALVDNLNSINCLIKLSDSGYVITLPEKKGEFKLL